MISKQAVKEYLDRKLDDVSWIKEVSKDMLLEEITEQFPDFVISFPFIHKMYKHQLACVLLGLSQSSFLFLNAMGVGKTLVCLALIKHYGNSKGKKTLVLVPNQVSISSWKEQIEEYTDLTWQALIGNKRERFNILKNNTKDILVMNYAGLQVFMSDLVKAEGSKKGGRVVNKAMSKEFASNFDILIADEIHVCKSTASLTYKLVKLLSKQCDYKYGLTGTPMGRSPVDLWSQFYLIDGGETLGETKGIFLEAFFTQKRNFWGGYDIDFKQHLQPVLHKKMLNKSIRYTQDEVSDLPPKVYVKSSIDFDTETYGYYSKCEENMKHLSRGNLTELKNEFVRMRMLCSGMLGFKNEDEESVQIVFENNPKLDMLEELVTSIGINEKIVIFHDFIKSGELISERLKKLKEKFVRIYSKTKDKLKEIDRFKHDDKIRILLINNKIGAMSLNLQVARYVLVYESPIGCIERSQMECRCHRDGQKRKTFIYDLVVKNSIEEKILMYLKEGKDLFKALVDGEL